MEHDVLELYDQAVTDWVTTTAPTGTPIVFATPERAFADYRERFNIATTDPLISPFVSVSRLYGLAGIVTGHRSNTFAPRKIRYVDEFKREWVGSAWPVTADLTYQIDIWARLRQDANVVYGRFIRRSNTAIVLAIDFLEPYSIKRVHLVPSFRPIDTTNYESGEDQRIFRHSFTYTLEAYLFQVFDTVGEIGTDKNAFTYRVKTVHRILETYDTAKEDPVTHQLSGEGTGNQVLTDLTRDISVAGPLGMRAQHAVVGCCVVA